jgi:hypothetical protein
MSCNVFCAILSTSLLKIAGRNRKFLLLMIETDLWKIYSPCDLNDELNFNKKTLRDVQCSLKINGNLMTCAHFEHVTPACAHFECPFRGRRRRNVKYHLYKARDLLHATCDRNCIHQDRDCTPVTSFRKHTLQSDNYKNPSC